MKPEATAKKPDLAALDKVRLDPRNARLLAAAESASGGPTAWRDRKRVEGRTLLAFGQASRRYTVQWLDLSEALRAVVEMEVTVPCLASPREGLRVLPRAILGLTYPEAASRAVLPGYPFVQVLDPGRVWHSNVSGDARQLLCLGAVPPGLPIKEIVLRTWAALTLQSINMDSLSAPGVMNPAAAEWWQLNTQLIPLSREPFLNLRAPPS